MLARWDPDVPNACRDTVLATLLLNGVDASGPALFETTARSALAAASGQSLIAFVLGQRLPCPVPIHFVKDLIRRGHARFRNSDPAGLFVTFVELVPWDRASQLNAIVYFLCPVEAPLPRRIAGGAVAEGAVADPELLRFAQGPAPGSGLNILQYYVRYGSDHTGPRIAARLRMMDRVYGLSLLGGSHDVVKLAAANDAPFADEMRAAVAEVLEEQLAPRFRDLAVAQQLRRLPALVVAEIGRHAGMRLSGARAFDERVVGHRWRHRAA